MRSGEEVSALSFWKRILEIMNYQVQVPTIFGVFHCACLLIVVLFCVWAVWAGKKHDSCKVRRVMLIVALLALILEVYKQINYTFGDGSGEPYYLWYAFPFQFCSTPIYVELLACLIRKGKVHDALCAYLSTFGLFAGLVVMAYPGQVFIETLGINIQTMYWHGSMVVMGVYLLASGHVKLEHKTILKALPVFVVAVTMAAVMNEVAYQTGLLEEHNFNMFYISPYCEPSLPVYSLVQAVVPFPASLIIYIFGFTVAGYLMLLLGMAVKKFTKKA